MTIKKLLPLAVAGIFLSACQSDKNAPEAQINQASTQTVQADVNRIQSHLHFLADDLLEGRDTGSRGHEIASLYIASEFQKYGLKRAGDEGSYLQRVDFRQAFLDQASPELTLTSEQGEQSLQYPKDYITYANVSATETNLQGELVFVGYGITAKELEHDDYQNIDVDGKIVVVLSGKPKSFPSEEGAHFGSGRQKLKYAADNGAIGYITIATPLSEKVRPYQNSLNYLHTPSVRWLKEDGTPSNTQPAIRGGAYFNMDTAAKVFAGASTSLEDVYKMLEEDKSPQGFALPHSISLTSKSEHKKISSPNVVGILEGSDPQLKSEYVVYSAHSDHIGFAKTVKKDKINNGAMDNASGTAVLMETARMFSEMTEKPKRSILFVAVSGEEKGLLGSDYFAQNPTVPEGSMVANVNLDMPILTYEFADIIAFGANHSDMQASVAKAAENIGLTLSPDPWPEQALFTRSDHYSFVKQGVPSVFLVPGLKSADPDVDGSKVFGEFLSTNYHKPGDDLNQPFNWTAARKFAEVNFQIGDTLANQENKPSWNEGDFFGNTFGK